MQDEDVLDAERLPELLLPALEDVVGVRERQEALIFSEVLLEEALVGRFEEAKSLIRKTMPVARRVLGESDQLVLGMRQNFALTLYRDEGSTLADLHDAVTMLEGIEPTARRVLGGAHPLMYTIELSLRKARAALRARETPSPSPSESS